MYKKFLLFVVLLIIIFNKFILSKIILFSLESLLNKNVSIEEVEISYLNGHVRFKNLNVIEKRTSNEKIVFFAREIYINFNLSSFFSTLIIIDNLNISEAKLNLNFKFSQNNKILDDNIEILKNMQNNKPKIYPKKAIDINFLIKNSKIIKSKVGIFKNDKEQIEIELSDMIFNLFGNGKNFQHFKDIFRIILVDIILRIPDLELRKVIKKTYELK